MSSLRRDDDDLLELFEHRTDPEARRRLVARYRPLADSLAERFVHRGTERDDARQTARLAVVKAIDGFDPALGVRFSTYASRTILGELKRGRRDRSWDVRVPRSLQERWLASVRARERLTHRLERAPTVAEIAEEIDATEEEVLEAFDAGSSHTIGSLDRPLGGESGAAVVGDRVGGDDSGFEIAEHFADLAEPLSELDDRERRILYLRFFRGMTQSEIGERVGISQMHVSRLLRGALEQLRRRVSERGS